MSDYVVQVDDAGCVTAIVQAKYAEKVTGEWHPVKSVPPELVNQIPKYVSCHALLLDNGVLKINQDFVARVNRENLENKAAYAEAQRVACETLKLSAAATRWAAERDNLLAALAELE